MIKEDSRENFKNVTFFSISKTKIISRKRCLLSSIGQLKYYTACVKIFTPDRWQQVSRKANVCSPR